MGMPEQLTPLHDYCGEFPMPAKTEVSTNDTLRRIRDWQKGG